MKAKLFSVAIAAGLLVSVTACGGANENLPTGGLEESEQENENENEPEQANEQDDNEGENEAEANEEEGEDDNS